MAKNFVVEVWQGIVVTDVIVKTMIEATSLVCNNLSKGRRVLTYRTDDAVTHTGQVLLLKRSLMFSCFNWRAND